MLVNGCSACGQVYTTTGPETEEAACPGCRASNPSGSQTLPLGQTANRPAAPVPISLDDGFVKLYQLESVLGRGATGVVFRARDRRHDRQLAIKFLTDPSARELVQRFRREAKLLAKLQHPNVVRIFALEEESEHPYLALEYLDGGTLRTRLTHLDPLPLETAIAIALDCLSGLEACHADGILHRDLKPENILFTPEGTAKLADFGLATARAQDERLTQTGAVVGTLRYMALEQLRGNDAGVPADVFAMGLILLEMLTGRPACNARNLIELLRWHEQGLQELVARAATDLPAALRPVLARALSPDPALRPPSAREFAAEIRRAVEPPARPVTLAPAPRPRSFKYPVCITIVCMIYAIWCMSRERCPDLQTFTTQVNAFRPDDLDRLLTGGMKLGDRIRTPGSPLIEECTYARAFTQLCERTTSAHREASLSGLLSWINAWKAGSPDSWLPFYLSVALAKLQPGTTVQADLHRAAALFEQRSPPVERDRNPAIERIRFRLQLRLLDGVDPERPTRAQDISVRELFSSTRVQDVDAPSENLAPLLAVALVDLLRDVCKCAQHLRDFFNVLRKVDPTNLTLTSRAEANSTSEKLRLFSRDRSPAKAGLAASVEKRLAEFEHLLQIATHAGVLNPSPYALMRNLAYLRLMCHELSLHEPTSAPVPSWMETWVRAVTGENGYVLSFDPQQLTVAVTQLEQHFNPDRAPLQLEALHLWVGMQVDLLDTLRITGPYTRCRDLRKRIGRHVVALKGYRLAKPLLTHWWDTYEGLPD